MITLINFKHKTLIVLSLILVCSVFISTTVAQTWNGSSNWDIGSNWISPATIIPILDIDDDMVAAAIIAALLVGVSAFCFFIIYKKRE